MSSFNRFPFWLVLWAACHKCMNLEPLRKHLELDDICALVYGCMVTIYISHDMQGGVHDMSAVLQDPPTGYKWVKIPKCNKFNIQASACEQPNFN